MKSGNLKSQNSAKVYGKVPQPVASSATLLLQTSSPTRYNSDHVMDPDGKLARVFGRLVPFRRPVASLWGALAVQRRATQARNRCGPSAGRRRNFESFW